MPDLRCSSHDEGCSVTSVASPRQELCRPQRAGDFYGDLLPGNI